MPDERWDDDALRTLRNIHGSDFEAPDASSLMADPDSGRVVGGAAPAPGPAPGQGPATTARPRPVSAPVATAAPTTAADPLAAAATSTTERSSGVGD